METKCEMAAHIFLGIMPELFRLPVLYLVKECVEQVLLNELQLVNLTILCAKDLRFAKTHLMHHLSHQKSVVSDYGR